jgi:uncharacterized protein YndB with AHSA1/START domain
MNASETPIELEHTFNAKAIDVWNALTQKDFMKQWYFSLEDFRAEKGFRFTFAGGPSPEKQYVHECEIQEAVPHQKLSYTWKYRGYPGSSLLTFTLIPQGKTTQLKLTHEGLESFPSDNPDFAKNNFEKGWDEIIHVNLKKFLEKESE